MKRKIKHTLISHVIEVELAFIGVNCEIDTTSLKDEFNSYVFTLYRRNLKHSVVSITVDKYTGSLVWLSTGTFGESSTYLSSLLHAFETIKERRDIHVTRVNDKDGEKE